jgi:nucleoside-diphosphate-sugar epimerase
MGCGWLGLPLAISLIKDGYRIHGTTTSEEKIRQLENKGIIPFLIALSEAGIHGNVSDFLKNVDVLVVNVPPKLRGNTQESFVQKIQFLHHEVKKSKIQKVIFVSSTSVYGDVDGEVTEQTIPQPSTNSGEQLLEAENIFKNDSELDTTIIRFGGLIGPNRHPVTMLSKRRKLSNGNAPINLIHLDDCIRIIGLIIANSWWNEIINGVYPEHPSKQKYYTKEAQKRNLQVPDYKVDNLTKGKIIHSNQLINVKNFEFTTTL